MEDASPKPFVPTAALELTPSAGAKLSEPKPTQPKTGAVEAAVEERVGALACWGALLVGEGLEDGPVEAAAEPSALVPETVPMISPFSFTSLRP